MTRWEYDWIEIEHGEFGVKTKPLNKAGREGWEVYAVTERTYPGAFREPDKKYDLFHLKRPIQDRPFVEPDPKGVGIYACPVCAKNGGQLGCETCNDSGTVGFKP